MGETRVDLLHLLEDLRDAYPGPTQETILTEIVANSLDSGARTITLATDQPAQTLTIVDDGRGMRRRELARYHDIAASTKIRGDTIGFAGVGIKIALLVSAQVVTETRAGRHHVATTWGLASRHRAPWKWTPPRGIVAERGTAIRPDARQRPLTAARPRLCRDGPAEPLRAAAHLDQRRPSRVSPGGGVALGGLSSGAGNRAGSCAIGRRTRERAWVRDGLPCRVGREGRPRPTPSPAIVISLHGPRGPCASPALGILTAGHVSNSRH